MRLLALILMAVLATAGGAPAQPGTAYATIDGKTVDWADAPLANAPVRLRDVRLGRVSQVQLSDKDGRFAFHKLDPGSFVVELLDGDRRVVTASEIVHLGGGDTKTVVVRVPRREASFGWLSAGGQALAVTAAAAASGILATRATGDDISPR
jgi:hypothetical protein